MFQIQLDMVRDTVLDHAGALAEAGSPYGRFRPRADQPAGFWGSVEVALTLYTVNVSSLIPEEFRREMVEVIGSYQRPDGSFEQSYRHGLFAAAMAQLACRALGGELGRMPALLAERQAQRPMEWLVELPWHEPAKAAEQLYGTGALLLTQPGTPPEVRDELLNWLSASQNLQNGWWMGPDRPETRQDLLLPAFAADLLFGLAGRAVPSADVQTRSLIALQARMGPAKGLFGSLDRPHWSEMCAAQLFYVLKEHVRVEMLQEMSRSAMRLLQVCQSMLSPTGEGGLSLDTTTGLLSRVQLLAILSKLLPRQFVVRRPWRLIWTSASLLRSDEAATVEG
mgnify:CR=1 FL=1